MGKNSIDRGSRDSWTTRPTRLDEITRLAAADRDGAEPEDAPDPAAEGPANPTRRLSQKYWDMLRQPAWRDPRGFILPADQPDFPTAVKFINALVKTGIAIHRATADFTVAGKKYPAGSYVVKTAQAFRPHVLDLFEPQDHPNDFRYEGGPPNRPYDVAGYTLAFTMGVQFDRVLEAFDGPFERLPWGQLQTPPATVVPVAAGWSFARAQNNSFQLVNRLLKAGVEVRTSEQNGDFFVSASAQAALQKALAGLGVTLATVQREPAAVRKLAAPRVALWDRYGGSMPSGWTRWLLEQFEFPFDVIYAPQIDAGKLREKYDAIIFVTAAIPAAGTRPPPSLRPRNLPAEYESHIGRITPDKSVPALKEFLAAGGSIVAIGSSTNLAYHLGLPIQSALTERAPDGKLRNLPDDKFYVPGSVLEARVDTTDPLAWGMAERTDFFFDRSPAFTLGAGAAAAGLRPVAWFDSDKPLRSGWAWGQSYLKDAVTVATAKVGPGRLHLMGAEIAFRAQPHGTFKLLFNALHLSTAPSLAP
jgi:hypothetical protein